VVLPNEAGAPPAVLDFISNIRPIKFNLDSGGGGGAGGSGGQGGGGRGRGDGGDGYGPTPGLAPREGDQALWWLEREHAELSLGARLAIVGLLYAAAGTALRFSDFFFVCADAHCAGTEAGQKLAPVR